MQFDFYAFGFTLAFVAFSALVSAGEDTFKNRQLTMDFLHHGGMHGDFFLLSIVNGLVSPYIKTYGLLLWGLAISLIVTLAIHATWEGAMSKTNTTCHIFPSYQSGSWHKNMSEAGWLHVGYMTAQLAIIIVYIFSPMPEATVLTVSAILTVHVFLGTVQPGWYCSRKLWTAGNFAPPIICTTLIWSIATVKLHSA